MTMVENTSFHFAQYFKYKGLERRLLVKNFETIIWEKVEDIGIITLNRPDRFNAVNDHVGPGGFFCH